jgi:peptidoglycan/LPS O-acetylase OafA/YrhL
VQNRVPVLDGLRGWGAVSVLLLHTFILGFPVGADTTTVLRKVFLFNGVLAVCVFFAVSGLSLSVQFCQRPDTAILVRTALGRYLRVAVPIALVTMSLVLLMHTGWLPPAGDRPAAWRSAVPSAPDLLETLRFCLFGVFFHYDPARSPNPPLWSMPYELWGSVLVLGLLFVAGRLQRRLAVYVASAALAAWVHPIYASFVAGLVMAEVHAGRWLAAHRDRIGQVATATLPVLAIAFTSLTYDIDGHPWQLVVAGVVLTFSIVFSPVYARWFSGRVSRFLGRISFPLYLSHTGVLLFYSLNAMHWLRPETAWQLALVNLSTVAVALLVGWLFVPADKAGIVLARRVSTWLTGAPSNESRAAAAAAERA